ncbi:MAG TPA: NAD(P)/FAD-dependent oxidoreductase [Acidimicrobiia bacterium]|nr:NAD(P)/FAD-dependent oxidoreductase [Acidimicrobiia bacterium]
MPISQPVDPIPDDDAAIRAALDDAYLPGLLAALAYTTGDLSLLRDELRPDPTQMQDPQAGMSPAAQAEARELAFDALRWFRDAGCAPVPPPSTEDLRRMMAFIAGDDAVNDDYLPLLREELGAGDDLRAPGWDKASVAPDREFTVAIVGAGMSGLLAAFRLQQAGVPFVIFEKNTEVGGTWWENRYPGCRVDVPNHLYSYSFAQKEDWPQRFSPQAVLLEYFRQCADDFGVRDHIRFETEVSSAQFDDARATWTLQVRTKEGREESFEANAIVSAVGQLNRPRFPDIPGMHTFAGPSFHSAVWDDSVELTGKRVAVVGSAASAVQLLPVVAEQAAHLTIFQRTPNWFLPVPDYHEDVPTGMRWLFRHLPAYSEWYRFCLFWRMAEGLLPAARVDPEWESEDGRTVSALNDLLRAFLTMYLQGEFASAPELVDKVVPDYPPLAKRVLMDNGSWARTLTRDNVDLVTEPIDRVDEDGIVTADGRHHDADVIVYATGFEASHFLTPMKLTGRGGVDLHDQWDPNAGAYLGITVPRFPNLFCLYGPNTNIVANGSIIFFSECEVHYLLECLRLLFERDARALDCRQDVYDAFEDEVDAGNRAMAWGVSSVNTWYKNETGRVTQNWPFSLLEYWQRTREPDPADYELL